VLNSEQPDTPFISTWLEFEHWLHQTLSRLEYQKPVWQQTALHDNSPLVTVVPASLNPGEAARIMKKNAVQGKLQERSPRGWRLARAGSQLLRLIAATPASKDSYRNGYSRKSCKMGKLTRWLLDIADQTVSTLIRLSRYPHELIITPL